jgi:hypothetical protein
VNRPDPPDKPLTEMTREELAAFRRQLRAELRELDRPRRERKLRRGLVSPRNRAEQEIFAADLLAPRRQGTEGEQPPA